MNKLTSSILSLAAFTAVSFANDVPMYDNAYAAKTKEVIMLSQLMNDGHNLDIDVTGRTSGDRGYFASLSENNDVDWTGNASINVEINNCFSEESLQLDEKAGYIFKSRIADGTIVAYREAVKQLKKNGAKYIFVSARTKDHSIQIDKYFADFFQAYLIGDFSLNDDKRGVSKTTGELLNIWRSMDDRCFQDNSFKASDMFWLVGQVAALAIGAKGASGGNTNMASLAAHSSKAVDHTTNLAGGSIVDNKMLSGIATRLTVSLGASIVANHYAGEGYSFPIAEVEEHLTHYKVIPYNVKKITSN